MGFTSVHNHTMYSNLKLLDSINKISELIDKAIEYGFKGIAITDHEVLSSNIELFSYGDLVKEKYPDFKIILGNEIYLIHKVEYKQPKTRFWHFILLAKDKIGYMQIRKLSSRAWDRMYISKGQKRTPTFYEDFEEVIGEEKGHLIFSTACLGGYLNECFKTHDKQNLLNFLNWMVKTAGKENVFLEMQDSDSEEQQAFNKFIVELSKTTGLPYIVTQDAHYLNKEDLAIENIFLNSKQESDREVASFYKYTYVKPESEIKEILSYLPAEIVQKAIDNTDLIYNMIQPFDIRSDTIIPQIHLPEFSIKHLLKEWYDTEDNIKYFAYSKWDQDRFLLHSIENGIIEKKITITKIEADRINTELGVLRFITDQLDQPMSSYLNFVQEIVNIAWNVSFCGVSRGSCQSRYINYLIGICQASPLPYDIPYWRFLNTATVPALTPEEKAAGKTVSIAATAPDVDLDFSPEKAEEIMQLMREHYGENNVLNTLTYKRESLKSAINTCGRGLGLLVEDTRYLSGLIPTSRGHVYSLKECEEGDEEKGYEAHPEVIKKIKEYPGLYEALQKIEGLVSGIGEHASAVYMFQHDYQHCCSLMRTPSGVRITGFDYRGVDACSGLKMDFLFTDCQTKLMKTMDLLLKYKQIEWQGSLRATYNKYLHPDVLDYENPEMWEAMQEGKISNLFQFDSMQGAICIKRTRPTSVKQLGAANAVMRLMSDGGGESPLDRYVRFRNDINEWYKEMSDAHLTKEEQNILKKYLEHKFGNSVEQEDLMLLVMDSEISNFTLAEATKFRKCVSKKKLNEIEKYKKLFFSKNPSARKEFLDYVWDKDIKPQIGYSFSIPHDIAYSIEAVQEANLATRYNPLFWECACLSVNAGSSSTDTLDGNDEEDSDETETLDLTQEEGSSATKKSFVPNYIKISKAVSDAQLRGVKIELPDINKAGSDFIPDIEHNSILYSLRNVSCVSDDLYTRILANRPYNKVNEFIQKVNPTVAETVGLIKAGCFDAIVSKPRRVILLAYLRKVARDACPIKDKLTSVHMKKILSSNEQFPQFEQYIRLFHFYNYVKTQQYDAETKSVLLTDKDTKTYFNQNFAPKMNLSKGEYLLLTDSIKIKMSTLKRYYDRFMEPFTTFFNSEEGKKKYQEWEENEYFKTLETKFDVLSSEASWEMSQLGYYASKHELAFISGEPYLVKDFNSLPEQPVLRSFEKDGQTFQTIDNVCSIVGTVVGKDNTKHIVFLLTPQGVVNVKCFNDLYNRFNATVSVKSEDGKKKIVLDKSWFERGTKLLIYGYRRENTFVAKNVKVNAFNRSICLIEKVENNGTFMLRYTRKSSRKE